MSSKIKELAIANFGVLPTMELNNFANINLVIGANGTGKTFLLKSMYASLRATEEYKRGDDIRPFQDVLSEKLRWTFQAEKLGDLVSRSSTEPLSLRMVYSEEKEKIEKKIGFQFASTTTSKIVNSLAPSGGRTSNSIFIPAKEVLSLYGIILKSREIDRSFGFDDTYYDLAKALRIAPRVGKNYTVFSQSRKKLVDVIDGKVDFDDKVDKWYYRNNRGQKFSIGVTAEGIKKISILDRLLGNGYLDSESIVFIDEADSALHPDAACHFLDMIEILATGNPSLQFFISSHSYFVIKKLALIAMNRPGLVKCISMNKGEKPVVTDLHDGMPDNSIIDTSIKLYEQEVIGAL